MAYANPVVVGNGTDTRGAYDWFVPTVAVQTLTLRFSAQSGQPNYQIWFAAPAPATVISGILEQADGTPTPSGTAVALESASGVPVADITGTPVVTPVDADGTFEIPTEQGSYRLSFVVPAGFDSIAPVLVTATSAAADVGSIVVTPTAVAPPVPLPSPPAVAPVPVTTPAPRLAATGTDAAPIALAAGMLLLLGSALVRLGRRRSTSHS